MPRKKKTTTPEEQRLLDAKAGDVAEHHPAVQAVLSDEFTQMTSLDATQVALMLEQILKGQESLIAKYDENAEEINKLKAMMERGDREIEQRLTSQTKEIQEILDRAESLKATGEEKDKIIAKGTKMYEQARKEAAVHKMSDQLKFADLIARMPKETVISPGEFIMVREGQTIIPRIVPEEVRIKHMVWRLPPNMPVEVPKIVADRLREKRASQAQSAQLKELLSKHMEQGKLAQEWNKLNESDPMPLAH